MSELSYAAAERHLAGQLRVQSETMRRKGVSATAIADDVASLERSIRATLFICSASGDVA